MNKNSQKPQASQEDHIGFIQRIITTYRDARYIYRGLNTEHTGHTKKERVNTAIHRHEKYKELFKLEPRPFHVERDLVEQAKRFYPFNPNNIEILTDLRHFGSPTNLIDFSYSLYVALFFACNGEDKEDGELILYSTQGKNEVKDIDYEKYPIDIQIIQPKATGDSKNRVLFQSSVFIYAPKGYISSNEYKFEKIPNNFKKPILKLLEEFHNINVNTIYNDLTGFIENKKKLSPAEEAFYKALAKYNSKEYIESIKDYTKVTRNLTRYLTGFSAISEPF